MTVHTCHLARAAPAPYRPRRGGYPDAVFTLHGDQFLEGLVRKLEEAPARIHERVAAELQARLAKVIDDQFADAVDPTGKPYLPPKDGGTPMQRTGALRASIRVVARSTPDGVEVQVVPGVDYAGYLQRGTRKMAPRRIVPGNTTAGALKWRAAAREAYAAAVRAWFHGA